MKNAIRFIVIVLSGLIFTFQTSAANVDVEWVNPEKFRDMEPSSGSKNRYQKRVMKNFDKYFLSLAERLPENYQLKIRITDVDLSGRVTYENVQHIRIIREAYFPKMDLSYELLDTDKSLISSGEAKLKDMKYLVGSVSIRYRNESLGYEKKMLKKWFNKTFKAHIATS